MFKKKSPGYHLFFVVICIAGVAISIINAYEANLAGDNFKLYGRSLMAVIFSGWAISHYQSYRSGKRRQREIANGRFSP